MKPNKTNSICVNCGHNQGQYGKVIASNGAVHYQVRCLRCGKNFNGPGKSVPKKTIQKLDIKDSAMPVFKDNRGDDTCSVKGCNNRSVEWNHFMPVHLVGEVEADLWPILPLCRKHHREWHNKVTPNMKGTDKIVIINFCPLCQKRVDRAAVLDILKPLDRWTVHCKSGAWAHITSDKDGLDYVIYMAKVAAPPANKRGVKVEHGGVPSWRVKAGGR